MPAQTLKLELLGGALDGHVIDHPESAPLPKEITVNALGPFKPASVYLLGLRGGSDRVFYRFARRN
jgi:hypothetical protein